MEFVTVKLTANDYNAIMLGLGKLPYEKSVDVINRLLEQVKAQLDKAEEAK